VASSAQVAGATLGKFLTGLVLVFVLIGGSLAATDSIAGEKERGTLETLLTTAARRGDIVAAKQLAVLVVALVVTVIQSLNVLVYIGFGLIPLPESFAVEVSFADVALIFLILLPTVAVVSSVLLLASGRAGTYKEAQLYFLPIFLAGLLLSSASMLPGIGLRSAVVLLPIANTSIAVREVLVGTYDWPFLLLGWLVSAGAALWVSRLSVRFLSTERLIMPSLGEGAPSTGPERFQRQVALWIGVLWVVMFVVAANVEVLASLRRQVLFNVVLLAGGGSWLMLLRYGLDPRKALALRLPRAPVWVAVLLGAPAGNLVAMGVFRLASLVLPVPEKWLESLSRSLAFTDLPLWQLIVFIAILPAIFEEVLFRGMLLHGLRRRFHPVALCLVVGMMFGFFHVSLYRIIPTAWLGLVLTALTLLTGSIFPAMAWHALNNAAALLAGRAGFPLASLEPTTYLFAAVVLAGAFWIVYRCRTPYPGLRRVEHRQ
jgi:sodium transport system permease protein